MHIEFHKIHLAYQAHEKHTQDEMHLKNYLVALINVYTVYSELTEIKTFTGINLEQSLHVCLCDIHWLTFMV